MDILVSPQIERLIRDALDEDIGAGDLATMATIPAAARGTGLFRAKKAGVAIAIESTPAVGTSVRVVAAVG